MSAVVMVCEDSSHWAISVFAVCVPHIHPGCGVAWRVWLLCCASLPLLQYVVYLCDHEVSHGQPHQH